jgi:hypothetical protein
MGTTLRVSSFAGEIMCVARVGNWGRAAHPGAIAIWRAHRASAMGCFPTWATIQPRIPIVGGNRKSVQDPSSRPATESAAAKPRLACPG